MAPREEQAGAAAHPPTLEHWGPQRMWRSFTLCAAQRARLLGIVGLKGRNGLPAAHARRKEQGNRQQGELDRKKARVRPRAQTEREHSGG